MKAKTRHFPITDFGGRGGLNVPFNLSKIVDNLVQFCSGRARWGSSGLFLNSKTANTSLFHNSFFIRITNLWNAKPIAIRSEVDIVPFKKKLKSFIYNRISSVFNQDDIHSYKFVCLKCRHGNNAICCS